MVSDEAALIEDILVRPRHSLLKQSESVLHCPC